MDYSSPKMFAYNSCCLAPSEALVGAAGFEPATFCSQSRRATKLRYAPNQGTEFYLVARWNASRICMVDSQFSGATSSRGHLLMHKLRGFSRVWSRMVTVGALVPRHCVCLRLIRESPRPAVYPPSSLEIMRCRAHLIRLVLCAGIAVGIC